MENTKADTKNVNYNSVYTKSGNLHFVCPYIEKIEHILSECVHKQRKMTIDEVFCINFNLYAIRQIGKFLHPEHDDYLGENKNFGKDEYVSVWYNGEAVLKSIRTGIKVGTITKENVDKKLDEIVSLYL